MLITSKFRVEIDESGKVIVSFGTADGAEYHFLMPVAGLRGLGKQIQEVIGTPEARKQPNLQYESSRYLAEAGPSGGWALAIANTDPPRAILRLRLQHGLEAEVPFLSQELAHLVRTLSEALATLNRSPTRN